MLTWLHQPAEVLTRMREWLPLLQCSKRFELLEVALAQVSPRTDFAALFDADILDRESGCAHRTRITIQQPPARKRSKALKRLVRASSRTLRVPFDLSQLVAERPSEGLILYPFPLDPRLSALPGATDTREVKRTLRRIAKRVDRIPKKIASCEIEVARYVPTRRCQLRYDLTDTAGGTHTIFAKLYPDDRGSSIASEMNDVAAAFGRERGLQASSPRSLAYLDDWHLLLQEKVAGGTLFELAQRGEVRAGDFARSGQALAVLRRSSVSPGKAHGPIDEIAAVRRLTHLLPDGDFSRNAVAPTMRALEENGQRLPSTPAIPVHRDCYDKQFLADGRQVALIDFDTLAFGHAEVDIANFVEHIELRRLQGSLSAGECRRFRSAFVEGYLEAAPVPLDPNRLAFYLCSTWLRHACLYWFRSANADLAHTLARRAARALQPRNGNGAPMQARSGVR